MEQVFSPDGVLLDAPSIDCISAVRQICLFAKKIELPCTLTRQADAEKGYVKCEEDLRSHVVRDDLRDIFIGVSRIVWGDILRGVPYGDPIEGLIPRHGPGVTAEGLRGTSKFEFLCWPERLQKSFPLEEFGFGSADLAFFDGKLDQVKAIPPRDEVPVKVCFVPKTLKTPRVIAAEPVYMQYAQQAVATFLKPRIETLSSYTSGRVNFSDQSINGKLALSSSVDGVYATLDMKEASDRVSVKHVWDMLSGCPDFRRVVFSCRSTRAKLPSGVVRPLRKFASMGSALCFPMEAMAFFIAVVSSRLSIRGKRVSPKNIFSCSQGLYVYGDDIIVPADEAPSICEYLELFGFKVNTDKSFWTGKFRESCGVDAYDGSSVKPVYVRQPFPASRADANAIVSTVSLANQLYDAGLWHACRYVRDLVERFLGPLPTVSRQSAGLGWWTFSNVSQASGWDKDLQRLKLRCLVPTPTYRSDPLTGHAALLKCLLRIGSLPEGVDHLARTVRYGNLALKRRWILV
jgi:hypothetical protein